MAEIVGKATLVRLVELFQRHRVEFTIIGGQAAIMHGSPIPSYDYDFAYQRSAENLNRLVAALKELHPTLRGAPKDLPFRLDAESLALGANYTFDTDLGPVDLLGWVEPFGNYEAFAPRAVTMPLGELTVKVLDLDDLIAIKRLINRPKDRIVLLHLEEIKRLKSQPSS